MKNLRHTSLERNVYNTYAKVGICRINSKREIHVQKIKVKK